MYLVKSQRDLDRVLNEWGYIKINEYRMHDPAYPFNMFFTEGVPGFPCFVTINGAGTFSTVHCFTVEDAEQLCKVALEMTPRYE